MTGRLSPRDDPQALNTHLHRFAGERTMKQASPFRFHLIALVAALALAGCSSTKLDTDVPVESRSTTPGAGSGAAGSGANSGATTQTQVTPIDLTKSTTTAGMGNLPRIVYFDSDSYVV